MLSVIKTAIITIIISFISGVLLDHYKNIAPRIVCSVGKGVPLKIRNKRIRAYVLTVTNISKQTIHNLNLNIQGGLSSLSVDDAKITKGLKFDISKEGNIYDVSIPFLSKNDKFSLKVFLEDLEGKKSRPFIALRSPENFKRIDSSEDDGFLNSLKSIPRGISECFNKPKNISKINTFKKGSLINKKIVISIGIVIILAAIGIFTSLYYKGNSNINESKDVISTNVEKEAEDKSNVNKVNNRDSLAKDKSESTSKDNSKQSSSSTNSKQTNNSAENTKTSKDKEENTNKDSSKAKENNKKDENSKVTEGKDKSREESKKISSESGKEKVNNKSDLPIDNSDSGKDSNKEERVTPSNN
ncbi:MAG: hypothetical protein K5986_03805 [Clostridium sp.]|nr:hypothetical protein [Clostridium sp.]